MIKVYAVKPTDIKTLDSTFLSGRHKSFHNTKDFLYLYQNPNSQRWIMIAEVDYRSGKRERIQIGFDKMLRFFFYYSKIVDITYANNTDSLKSLLNGESLSSEHFKSYSELNKQ